MPVLWEWSIFEVVILERFTKILSADWWSDGKFPFCAQELLLRICSNLCCHHIWINEFKDRPSRTSWNARWNNIKTAVIWGGVYVSKITHQELTIGVLRDNEQFRVVICIRVPVSVCFLFPISKFGSWGPLRHSAGWYTVTFHPSASLVRHRRNALSSLLATMSSYIPFISFVFFCKFFIYTWLIIFVAVKRPYSYLAYVCKTQILS